MRANALGTGSIKIAVRRWIGYTGIACELTFQLPLALIDVLTSQFVSLEHAAWPLAAASATKGFTCLLPRGGVPRRGEFDAR